MGNHIQLGVLTVSVCSITEGTGNQHSHKEGSTYINGQPVNHTVKITEYKFIYRVHKGNGHAH